MQPDFVNYISKILDCFVFKKNFNLMTMNFQNLQQFMNIINNKLKSINNKSNLR